ncbi:MAG: hypothetical protein OEW08_12595 [Gammaproteobacteria bacterium]|nr:hypothetical protein [Gammaproteobacteria bacterium]
MKNQISLLSILLTALVSGANAEDTAAQAPATDSTKLEVIDKKLDNVIVKQDQIYRKVENDPLKGKRFGVEANFVRVFAPTEKDLSSFSGGFSYFDANRVLEISVPFFTETRLGSTKSSYTVNNLDVHVRKFLGETINGFYLSAFARGTHQKGRTRVESASSFGYTFTEPGAIDSDIKFGFGVGLGYRIFSKSGLYWGTGLISGRYISGGEQRYYSSGLDDTRYIVDFEFFKFGYAF